VKTAKNLQTTKKSHPLWHENGRGRIKRGRNRSKEERSGFCKEREGPVSPNERGGRRGSSANKKVTKKSKFDSSKGRGKGADGWKPEYN